VAASKDRLTEQNGTQLHRVLMKIKGITLIELLVVIAIMGILATAVMPLSRMTVKRAKEIELRGALRTLRTAIDEFRRDCQPIVPGMRIPGVPGAAVPVIAPLRLSSDYCKAEQDYYPESLEQLTQPLKLAGAVDKTRKYLRRIPRDPMTELNAPDNPNNWGLRSYSDQPDSSDWGGGNVFDVYSKSEAVALDGSKYNTW
jgi:general secretion pathway protein G